MWTEPRLTACRPQKAPFSWIRYRKKACCPQKAPFLWTRYQGKACHPQNAPNPWTVYEKFAGQHTCAIGFSSREGNNADKNIIKSAPEKDADPKFLERGTNCNALRLCPKEQTGFYPDKGSLYQSHLSSSYRQEHPDRFPCPQTCSNRWS